MDHYSNKISALASFLQEQDADEIYQGYDETVFEYGNQEYLVLTDEEATEKAKERIEDSLWAFNSKFIVNNLSNQSDLQGRAYDSFISALDKMKSELCEDANCIVKMLIQDNEGSIDSFTKEALKADGRGHFLSSYDGEEREEIIDDVMYFIYRQN